jgi:transketolase
MRNTDAPAAWQAQVHRVAHGIRCRVLDHILRHHGGYMSQACSTAEMFATLYLKVMNLGPSQAPMVPPPFAGVPGRDNPHYTTGAAYNGPRAPQFDRLIFSPAHYALVLYTTLIEVGRMAPEGLDQFNRDGSTVEMIGAEHSPGFETTTGSLAQAISQAGGIALARRLKGETGRVWVVMSDGEFQEGQTWEAFQALAHYRLDNVGVYVDVNAQQCDGAMTSVMSIEPLAERLRSFGARVFEVDGHDPDALAAPAAEAPDGRPLVVLAKTDPCRGVEPLRERSPNLHYLRFKSKDEEARYAEWMKTMLAAAPAAPATKPAARKPRRTPAA